MHDPPGFEDEASLYGLATEYLHAAEILSETPVTKLNVALVVLFLLGHAAELLLKSYLVKAGASIPELKAHGHNLAVLVMEARAAGLRPQVSLTCIVRLSADYTAKFTEYRQLRAMEFPPQDLLLAEVRALQSLVFSSIAELPR